MAVALIDFADFVTALSREFEVEPALPASPDSGLFDDLGLDSLGAFHLLLFLEALAGVAIPPDDPPEMFTVADAYGYYRYLWQHGAGEQSSRDTSGGGAVW